MTDPGTEARPEAARLRYGKISFAGSSLFFSIFCLFITSIQNAICSGAIVVRTLGNVTS